MQRDTQIAFPAAHLPFQSISQLPVKVGVQLEQNKAPRVSRLNIYFRRMHIQIKPKEEQ